ncbi:MAG: hypothetical protein ACRDOK_08125 [Streptosporangiaceae bacterium]
MTTLTSRASGCLLILLGAWGALVPLVGPYFGYAYTPDKAWTYTTGRLWLSVLPGAAAFLGGLLISVSARATAAGALIAALSGIWFVVGVPVLQLVKPGTGPGSPATAAHTMFSPATMHFLENLGFFYGLGVVIVFFAALGLGLAGVARIVAREFEQAAEYDAAY